jgi:hypothetical protein
MLAMARFLMTNGVKKFITKYGSSALNKVKEFIQKNPKKVEGLKPTVKQESVENLPLFKKPKYDFSDLVRKTDTTNKTLKGRTKGMDISKGM